MTVSTPKNSGRVKVTASVNEMVLIRCKRRCCLCFGLNGSLDVCDGQIAHIDRNSSHSDEGNLVFLCQLHHNEYDSVSHQTKRLTTKEVQHYQRLLHRTLGTSAVTWQVTIKGTLEDLDEHTLNQLVDALRSVAGERVSMSLRKVIKGSIILRFEGDAEAFAAIQAAYNSGKLLSIVNHEVMNVEQIRPPVTDPRIQLALDLIDRDDTASAIQCLDTILAEHPECFAAWTAKACSLLKQHYNSNDESYLRHAYECACGALELDTREPMAWVNKGVILCELNRLEEALRCFEAALSLNTRNSFAWFNKGITLMRAMQYEAAAQALDRATQLGHSEAATALREARKKTRNRS